MDTVAIDTSPRQARRAGYRLPLRFWTGVALVACWWPIAWFQVRPFSDNYFFPLWLGFILTLDGLVKWRTGTSLLERAGWRAIYLFALSAPLWWVFEGFNQVSNNWIYHLPQPYGDIEYAMRASLAFSTVIPAVLVTTELVRSMRLNPLKHFPALALENQTLIVFHLAGWVMFVAVLAAPRYAFPLVWISLFFIVDPIATWLNGRSVGSFLRSGDWSPLFNVAAATLICGFFWEFWNFYALPKWSYDVPYADLLHLFEMPLLGYGGYIPFGFEIVAVVALAGALAPPGKLPDARLSSVEPN